MNFNSLYLLVLLLRDFLRSYTYHIRIFYQIYSIMKLILLSAFLSLSFIAYGQITFEEITGPADFNIKSVRKSPTGEYFTQASNDKKSIYSSPDGEVWTKATLPVECILSEIQFFSDGTPVLQTEETEHLIRRNGTWNKMKVPGTNGFLETSFVKDDTLFAYQQKIFAYSLDKGESFTKLFTSKPNANVSHIYKFEHYLILHHTLNGIDSVSVYNKAGLRVLARAMYDRAENIVFNVCGQVLFLNREGFYLLNDDLEFSHSTLASLYPKNFTLKNFWSAGSDYYLQYDTDFYKTNGCNFTWEKIASYAPESYNELFWIGPDGTLLFWEPAGNTFLELTQGTSIWKEYEPEIDYTLLGDIDESSGNQIVRTSNSFFTKNLNENSWTELDTTSQSSDQIQYSPNGDLYINKQYEDYLLYSTDNGQHLSRIYLPQPFFFFGYYDMHVLGDGIIFVQNSDLGLFYYTINNGEEWRAVLPDPSFLYDPFRIKLIDNKLIVMTSFDYYKVITIINTTNNTVTTKESDAGDPDVSLHVLSDHGTIYFEKNTAIQAHSLFRIPFGAKTDSIGVFPELYKYHTLVASGDEIYFLSQLEYYQLDGDVLTTHPYVGLPGPSSFYLAESEYLYAIYGSNRIFRSTKPLSYHKYVSGNIYMDPDKDCIQPATETNLANWQVKVENGDKMKIVNTNRQGHFEFSVPDGDYTLSANPINRNWEMCTQSYDVAINDQQVNVERNFLAYATSACSELEIDFSAPLLRRCFDNYYSIRVRNTGPDASAGTVLTLELDPYYEFISATIPFEIKNDSIIKFDLGVLELNEEITFQVFFKISCNAPLGIEHCLKGLLDDAHECGDTRSYYEECQHNIGSFDPNDKRMFNEAGKETQRIDKGEYIYYHIRFQNSGTDTAFNVRVVDPLSSLFDLSTLEMLSASHPYVYSITDGPSLLVEFENIMLPDSNINEVASHGYFKFRVKPRAQLDYGTSIPNQAGIYFDFNAPVLTNETSLLILPATRVKDPVSQLSFEVYPNPVSNLLNLHFEESNRNKIDTYEIVNLSGHIMMHSKMSDLSIVNVAALNPGVYVLQIKGSGKVLGAKTFVKQNLK